MLEVCRAGALELVQREPRLGVMLQVVHVPCLSLPVLMLTFGPPFPLCRRDIEGVSLSIMHTGYSGQQSLAKAMHSRYMSSQRGGEGA